jgi:spermidine synthase
LQLPFDTNKKNQGAFVFYLILFFTGFSFLVFEVSWFRMLSFVIGATVSASTIVLVAFMSGFGMGAYFWGRKVFSSSDPLKLLFLLLVSIGVWGLLNYYFIIHVIPELYLALSANGFSGSLSEFIIFMCSVIALFIPAFLMGGILPVISKILIRSNTGLSIQMGKIYALETLGSTLGGFTTGFLLIGNLGQKNTIFIAVAVNLIIGGILLFLKKYYNSPGAMEIRPEVPDSTNLFNQKKVHENLKHPNLNKKTALLAAFICGFVVVGMQVIWFRIFKVYMTNTSYTFTLIASTVISGMFAGSCFYTRTSQKIKEQSNALLKLILYMGLFLLVGFFFLLNLPSLLFFPLGDLQETYIVRIIVIPLIASLCIIVPVTFISGYAFPLACTMYSSDYKNLGPGIGRILLSNTAGSVLGPLFAAYILIPFMGAALSVLVFLFVLLLFSLIISLNILIVKKHTPLKAIIIISTGIVLIVLLFRPALYILPPSFSRFEKKILAYKETVEGTYVVGQESHGQNTVLSTYVNNSAVIGSTYDAIKAVKMVGHIPFFAGLECKNALVIGFGIGVTASAIASHSEVKSIDCVELVAGLKDAAHYYNDLNNQVENDLRLKIYSGDGRHYLQSTSKKYDLISSDPTHPILGSGNIYTKEYFELCKNHLSKGGMVSQYLPLHKLLLKDLLGIIKTFHSVFPNATVWIGHYHAILIGSKGTLKIDFSKWTDAISKSTKDIYFYTNPYHVAACLILDSAQIEKTTKEIKINTDDRSYLEFFSFSSFKSENLTQNLLYLSQNRSGVNNVFYNIEDKMKMNRFIKGNVLLTEGLYYFLQGNTIRFGNNLNIACKENPEDEEFPFLIKFYFR